MKTNEQYYSMGCDHYYSNKAYITLLGSAQMSEFVLRRFVSRHVPFICTTNAFLCTEGF